ncbi:glycerophosphodiester phosphodiesterase family protein [Cryobacterium sp. CG_9.6]|uniref:glycerophosphodiester phosphodiesterase family protein n=1 Tax=Cryobacterium sp. CG_9.6 TaxID=2760710 RepID=UPI0024733EC9|nr:glycerophosphodiester phosphodiesterase family protein [Cryobacterium sp. CG_9.6]MDH6236993.1 glycerophosphoryl diester phosphodiesterase [Cryobacterium sp. CG_9.6]
MSAGAPSRFLAQPGTRILAHRGLAREAPENTLLAFLSALASGATHLETDVHASSDAVAVISHDPDLARLGLKTRIDQSTVAELKRCGLGNGQFMPSLSEALDAFPDALFNIDIKADDAVVPTVTAILEARAIPRVLITSFSEERRHRACDLLPGVATSASSLRVVKAVLAATLAPTVMVRRSLRGLAAVQVPETAGPLRIVTPRFVRRMHDVGVEVHVWTVNDVSTMRRLLDIGVDGLVTDRTDIAVALVAERG